MSQENRFGEYIAKLRMAKGISLEQLSDGLCDFSLLSRFERGEREAEKLLQNRFLTRLGVVPENYENFLYYKDYCRWENRQEIIHNILDEKVQEAKLLLEEYRRKHNMKNALEQQFYLAMLVQIRRYEGADREELADLFGQALELTVPDIDTRSFRNRVLSLEEMNLLLEYRYCRPQGVSLLFYEMLLNYIEKMGQTTLAMAKAYPKTVYYYYITWRATEDFSVKMAVRMMELCDKAIELLRNSNRMFYLWELFCMKEELTPKLPEGSYCAEDYAATVEECRIWREILEELYREYGVSIEMYEFCYLYVESEYYCIGDVIRIRRKMLGLSQEKLCEGICSVRTVSRLERNLSKPQKEIVQKLFDRLNLSTELCRTELVTDSQEAIEKYEELKKQANIENYKEVEVLLKEIKELISMNNPSNIQAVMKIECLYKYINNKISKDEYIIAIKIVLECTVPYSVAISLSEKYLTNVEIACLQNIIYEASWSFSEMEECVNALINLYDSYKNSSNYTRVYEFIMMTLASKLGNKEEYDISNDIMKNVIKTSLKCCRMKTIDSMLYGISWNDMQKTKNRMVEKELNKCMQISRMSKHIGSTKFYEEKKNS